MNTIAIKRKIVEVSTINTLTTSNGIKHKSILDINSETNNGESHSASSVLANVIENEEEYELQLLAPGIDESNIEFDIDDDNVITIKAKLDDEDYYESDDFQRREFTTKSFKRSFQLPDDADAEEITAIYKSGIITFFIPKKIELNVEEEMEALID